MDCTNRRAEQLRSGRAAMQSTTKKGVGANAELLEQNKSRDSSIKKGDEEAINRAILELDEF